MKSDYGSGWAIVGYQSIQALAAGIAKAGSTDSDKVSAALKGLTFDTPVGKRTFNPNTQETEAGEYWAQIIKDATHPFAVMKEPTYMDPQPLLN